MGRSIARIAALTVLLTLVLGAVVLSRRDGLPAAIPHESTWLKLLENSMDARHVPVRHLLAGALELTRSGSYMDSLAYSCGRNDADEPREHYRAVIGDWALAENRKTWEIDIYPEGNHARVLVRSSLLGVPPPPPPPGVVASDVEQAAPVPRVTIMPLERLVEIQRIWSVPDLWSAESELTGCTDGRPAFFQACVHGRFYASKRSCSHARESVSQLWNMFQQHLPAPPPHP